MEQIRPYLAEFIGTYALVFCGTGAIIINDITNGSVGNTGIALTFGAIVAAMIYSLGHVSGAHINPAVSFAFWLQKKLTFKNLFAYMLAQFVGGISASATLKVLFHQHSSLGATLPYDNIWSAFFLEIFLSFLLMFVIIQSTTVSDRIKSFAGLIIGLTVMLEAAFAGPLTGASMNPARSLGPAIISGQTQYLTHYIAAAFIGMAFSVIISKYIKKHEKDTSIMYR